MSKSPFYRTGVSKSPFLQEIQGPQDKKSPQDGNKTMDRPMSEEHTEQEKELYANFRDDNFVLKKPNKKIMGVIGFPGKSKTQV